MEEDELPSAAMHAGKRRWLVVVGGNVALLVVMLGVPWLRGHLRTRALLRAFASYGACLFDGRPRDDPGLGMPPGHEARFATRVEREPGFASRCDTALSALAPEPAIFILPGLKVAEGDLRAAAALVREQLATLATRTPGEALSIKPLAAIERLRAGLANHALASGRLEAPDAEAFRLSQARDLPTPTRLPLATGAGAALALWGSDAELHALAIDRAGISYAQLRAGKIEQTRTPRPKLLEASVPAGVPSAFVWAMPKSRCDARQGGCADKALGVAGIRLPIAETPAPRWLGAHPGGRPDRSVLRGEDGVRVAAMRADGDVELRTFTLAPGHDPASADLPPLAAAAIAPVHAPGDPLLLLSAGRPRLLLAQRDGDAARVVELTDSDVQLRARLEGAGTPWLVGCDDGAELGLAFGHENALVLAALRGDEVVAFPPVEVALRDVIDEADPARDRVVRLCVGPARALALALDRRGKLLRVQCLAGAERCEVAPVAAQVRTFAARVQGGRLVVAYASGAEAAQIRVRSDALDGQGESESSVPATCWSDARGMCGPPSLAEAGRRLLLAAREGADLRVLESADGGRTFSPLAGLSRYH
ncbi:MAG: hypothetical protein ABW252_25655 [Polyangiales bacterium]